MEAVGDKISRQQYSSSSSTAFVLNQKGFAQNTGQQLPKRFNKAIRTTLLSGGVGITATWTVKPCQADRSGNSGQPELSFSQSCRSFSQSCRSFSWSCTGGNTSIPIVATSSVDKYGLQVCNIAVSSSISSNSIYSMLRIYHYYYCDFINVQSIVQY